MGPAWQPVVWQRPDGTGAGLGPEREHHEMRLPVPISTLILELLFGDKKVKQWRRSYDVPLPSNGESLDICAEHAVKYFVENVRILKPNHHLFVRNQRVF